LSRKRLAFALSPGSRGCIWPGLSCGHGGAFRRRRGSRPPGRRGRKGSGSRWRCCPGSSSSTAWTRRPWRMLADFQGDGTCLFQTQFQLQFQFRNVIHSHRLLRFSCESVFYGFCLSALLVIRSRAKNHKSRLLTHSATRRSLVFICFPLKSLLNPHSRAHDLESFASTGALILIWALINTVWFKHFYRKAWKAATLFTFRLIMNAPPRAPLPSLGSCENVDFWGKPRMVTLVGKRK